MRIALVICLFGPDEMASGAVRIAHETARRLSRSHEVHVFGGARSGDQGLARVELESLIWWRFRVDPFLDPAARSSYHNPAVEGLFETFLREVRPELVHFHALQGLGGGLVERAAGAGAATVVHLHDWWWFCPYLFLTTIRGEVCPIHDLPRGCGCLSRPFLEERYAYLRPRLQAADLRIFVSPFIRSTYAPYLPEGLPSVVLENPVARVEMPADLSRAGRVRLAYFGGDSVHKGYPVLKEAVSMLRGRFQMDYYGFDTPCSSLKGWLRGLLSKGVERYHRRFSHRDYPAILSGTDVVVVPSTMLESYNLVVREVMGAGVPVIASRSGGPEDVVEDGVNGWLFPRGDSRALASIIQGIIDRPEAVERAREALRRSPIRLKGWGEYIEGLERAYREALNG